MVVDIPVVGTCVTRNGESQVSRMVACDEGDGQASIRFVSAKLRRALHSGVQIRVVDLDDFCKAWLKVRGTGPVNVQQAEDDLDRALESLKKVRSALNS